MSSPYSFIRMMILVIMGLFLVMGWNGGLLATANAETTTKQQQQQQFPTQLQNQQPTSQGKPQQLVVSLTSKTFDRSVSDGNVWLIEFYAPWCAHCQSFAGIYEEVAYHLQHAKTRVSTSSSGSSSSSSSSSESSSNTAQQQQQQSKNHKRKSIHVGKINTASERALATRFSISSLPSFYVIDGWSVYEFRGYRSLQALVEFAKGGYLQVEPVPFLMSPMGPMGQLQGLLVTVGFSSMDVFYMLQRVTGLSATLLSIAVCLVGISLTFFSVILLALFFTPKSKVE